VNGTRLTRSRYATTDTVDDAIARMQTMNSPWLVYLAFNSPHPPFHVPPASLRSADVSSSSSKADMHDAAVEAIDHEFGRLLAGIPKSERGRTTVILMGDNGTDGAAIRPPFKKSRRKKTLYEGGVKVPLLISGPHIRDPGSSRSQLVHVADIFPTLAELSHVSVEHEIDGVSLVRLFSDPDAIVRDHVYAERFKPHGPPPYSTDERMVRDSNWKLIRRQNSPDEFFSMQPGALDEGENLLPLGLNSIERAAYRSLEVELEKTVKRIGGYREK
jgi:arylsulfatase A-like enzyme